MKKSFLKLATVLVAFSIFAAGSVYAGSGRNGKMLRVTITNITQGQIFSPPIIITHNKEFTLFNLGEPASPELSLLAEDGDPSKLLNVLADSPSVLDTVVANGPVLPGTSLTIDVDINRRFGLVSLAGMLVTTNDAFVAVRGERVPFFQKDLIAVAYDAGSEENSEDCAFIPGPPCGNGGVRDTDGAEGYVYIHSGIHGVGDLEPERDDWRNPVAKIHLKLISK